MWSKSKFGRGALRIIQILQGPKAGRENRGTQLWAPLVAWSKTRIVEEALRLKVPIQDTWSCYTGGDHPCGVCDSCRIRDAALHEAGRPDLCSSNRR